MNHDQFVLWFAGFVDALEGRTPTAAQWATINGKLDSCFNKVTPDRTGYVHAKPLVGSISTRPSASALSTYQTIENGGITGCGITTDAYSKMVALTSGNMNVVYVSPIAVTC